MGQSGIMYYFCDTNAKSTYPESNHERTSDKPKLREMLQNNWSLTFKSAVVLRA